jgi:hypothetical protein
MRKNTIKNENASRAVNLVLLTAPAPRRGAEGRHQGALKSIPGACPAPSRVVATRLRACGLW